MSKFKTPKNEKIFMKCAQNRRCKSSMFEGEELDLALASVLILMFVCLKIVLYSINCFEINMFQSMCDSSLCKV